MEETHDWEEAPEMDPEQMLSVTRVEVVQSVEADKIVGTLRWLLDRVGQLSQQSPKKDLDAIRDSLSAIGAQQTAQVKEQARTHPYN
jgi:hypothetical protein